MRHIDRFILALRSQELAAATINIRLRILKTALRWMYDREEIGKLPRIRLLQAEKKLPRVLSEDDLQVLLARLHDLRETAPNFRQRRFYALHERYAMVASATGARLAEVFWLPWSNIELDAAEITIRVQTRHMVKEKREKVIPIPGFLVGYLSRERTQAPDETWLLDNGNGEHAYTDPSAFTRAFQRHFRALGFDKRGIKPTHGFRALYATRLRNKLGVDVHTIKDLLGHSRIEVTEGYFSNTETSKRVAVDKLNKLAQKWHVIEGGKRKKAST